MQCDVLLIQPPIRDFYLTAKRTIPYGLSCIAASLIKEGFSVMISDALATSKTKTIHPPSEMDYLQDFYDKADSSPFCLFHSYKHYGRSFESIGKSAYESGAFLVGISSLFTAYIGEALRTAISVKAHHPTCKIVLGGHHPTAFPEHVLACDDVDYVIRGEGELAIPILARAVQSRRELESVPGIAFRNSDGSIFISEPARVPDLNDMPLPALHLIDNDFYKRKKKGTLVITASRGCPMKCSYCAVGSAPIPYRRRSVSSVIHEIDHAVANYDTGFIDFEDEHLSLNRDGFEHLLAEIRKRYGDALELRAMNGLLPVSLDTALIRSMKASGFKALNLSIGSLSDEQQKRFHRPDMKPALEQIIPEIHRLGMEAVGYVIIGAPGQNALDSIRDLLYLYQRNILIGASVFYPAPGTEDARLCEKKNCMPQHFSLMRSGAIPVSDTTSRLESVTILRLGRILNFMKSLNDRNISIPEPEPFSTRSFLFDSDRLSSGIRLLSHFLHDGKIRGIWHQGEVYEHRVSTRLVRNFLSLMSGHDSHAARSKV